MESVSKIKKKKFPKSINEMSKETLQETLKKKKECNAKAQTIVERLCESHVDEEWFLANLQYINQAHFDDATIERAITKVCGYPLCTQALDKILTQQYHISTRYNKVFDITERKNFCSNCCYKSAMYVKKQLFTSPLWFRDQETIPQYKILKNSKSSLGEEVVFLPDKIAPEPGDLKLKYVPKSPKLDNTICELEGEYANLTVNKEHEKANRSMTSVEKIENITNLNTKKEIQKIEFPERVQGKKNETDEDKCITLQEKNNAGVKQTSRKVENNEPVNPITKVEKSIIEWFSVDTFFYLYSEQKLKELLSEDATKMKELLNSKLSRAGRSEKIDRMIKLYGLLDTDCFTNNNTKMNLKPLPNYSALKEQGKTLEVKVKAFYQGQVDIKPNDKKEEKKEETEEDENPIYMPLVDAHAQTALRRKIVLDKLNKLLPEIIRVFSSDYIIQMNDIRNLVATFLLSANNITFKPTEWYLVCLFIIKLLSLKDKSLECIVNEESSQDQILLILKSYGLEKNYLDDLISRINNSSVLMMKLNEINR